MENPDVERNPPAEDGNQLNRNRSFKSKQLVRSQAIRESTSPPRTISPSVHSDDSQSRTSVNARVTESEDNFDCRHGKQRVEIQITSNAWESDTSSIRGMRRRGASTTDLLSNNPRVACICGTCAACPHCRGRRRRVKCPTKQDSGIVCSDECADYSDSEPNGNELKKSTSGSLDVDEQYYCRCAERKDKPKNVSLSRNDSDDRTELMGPELVSFIKETLNKNARDRTALLKIEKELHCFINDTGRCIVKFPVMTSYGRMLVHRCAALFQLAHHLDQSNKTCVIVSKAGTSGGRIPCTSFKTWCVANFPPSPMRHQDSQFAKSILKRDNNSLDSQAGAEGALARSKSLEQREKDYERVRRRIFSEDNCHHDESQWPWISGPVKLLTPETGRNKLLKVQSLENPPGPSPAAHPSWRGPVSKSHSFGGYGDRQQHRTLSRQGDLASSSWRLSPSSSGYKTLSLRSTDSVTPSPTGGGTPEPGIQESAPTALVWAVTDLSSVPHGALVIHPQTGRPLTNPDGSVYHFDPANPPVLYDPNVYIQTEHNKIDQNNEKRRGRLEKQHSFMDNDNECQSSEECRSKCCCECRKQEHTINNDKPIEKEPSKPPSPKPAEPPKPEPTSQKEPEPNRYDNNQRNYNVNTKERADVVHYNAYAQHYTEEAPVQQINPYLHQEVPNMGMIPQAKASVALQDPNIRPVSLTNIMYQPTMQPPYAPYITNQRMDQIPQQMYQPLMQQVEEPKQISSPQQENTFRIDPSYPYPAVDYSGACGGCVDTQPPRSFSVPYGQVEVPTAILPPPPYPVHNVLHLPHYPVQYQEQLQWSGVQQTPKLYEMCPVLYPQTYPHYNIIYPQMVQQPYTICPPIYPVQEKDTPTNTHYRANRTSLPTPRTTPGCDDKDDKQNSTEIAAKIQQIKDQMSSLNTRSRTEAPRQWRRNTGNGILGNCPQYDLHTGRANNDDSQLSSAARAIVNSIRNMHSKNTYHQQDRRTFDNRRRYEREHDKNTDRHGNNERQDTNMNGRGDGDRRFDSRNRMNPVNIPYRPPYLFRQMSPGTWCRRSPAPIHPGMNQPRRAPPDPRPRR